MRFAQIRMSTTCCQPATHAVQPRKRVDRIEDRFRRGRCAQRRIDAVAATLAIASRIAKNTEKGSSSGGSPTALERRMVSSTLWLSNSRVLNCAGQSVIVGIL